MTRRSFVLAAAAALLPFAALAGKPTEPARRKTALKPRPKAAQGTPYGARDDVLQAADAIAAERGLDVAWTRRALAEARMLPVVARLMQPMPAGTPKNWAVYRSRFIDPVRIQAGVRFWQDNRATLLRAEQEFGVPPEMVVGIIGVETIYGQQMGTFRVLDALATLAFDFPAVHPRAAERAAYFRSELGQFLAIVNGGDPTRQLGSYAGAMGMPQFMPSSSAKWAVDYDGDGRIELARSPADAIGSVANYFLGYGWQPGMPTHFPVAFDAERLDKEALLAPDILPTFSVPSFLAKGALLDDQAVKHPGPLALVELQNGNDPPTYVAGTENFYVITRYNWSAYYAMAVIELGREIQQALPRGPT
jgi:membrane-bound lytic murein transglycosylase B